jgi:thiosulfate/3-mercaptopyruvate sulfurtransferase
MLKGTAAKTAVVLVGAAVMGPTLHGYGLADRDYLTKQSKMLVSSAWLQKHLGDHDLVILYVGRDRSQFDTGHIPGSRFVRLNELVEQRKDSLNELPPVADLKALFESVGVGDSSQVVLYGEGGGLLAARAYFTFDYLGHGDKASLLDGGWEKWTAEARPISRDEPRPIRAAHFTPHVQPEIVISSAVMLDLSREATNALTSQYVLLDARPVKEFDGVVNSEAVPKAGHIGGAHSLHWKRLILSETMPVLLDPAELQDRFMRAGVGPGQTVVTYCRTGMQSSFTYFVAKYLGYRAAMYDGSVYEWVHRAGNDLVVSPKTSAAAATRP